MDQLVKVRWWFISIYRMVAKVTAEPKHDNMDFTCDLFFEKGSGEVKDPPTFTDSCHTSFRVLCWYHWYSTPKIIFFWLKFWYTLLGSNNHADAPTNIQTDPNPEDFEGSILILVAGDLITCSAEGNPDPQYSWHSFHSSIIIEGDTLQTTEEMVGPDIHHYFCQSTNTIYGQPLYAHRTVSFQGMCNPVTNPCSKTIKTRWNSENVHYAVNQVRKHMICFWCSSPLKYSIISN